MLVRILIFLVLNFAALGIGGMFTKGGVPSDWYVGLNKAPWTPPGWAFGFAWTGIMLLFSIYMAYLWQNAHNKKLAISLFAMQWLLNVAWNPTFFYYHQITMGLLIIVLLAVLIGFMLLYYSSLMKIKSALLLPYFIWLLIACSLNGYVFLMN